MEYKELIDAFAAKCGLEQPDAKDGVELSEDVTFSQVFSPDKIRHNPNVEAVL